MKTMTYTVSVAIPEIADFLEKYSRYSSFVSGDGQFLFDLIMTPENVIRAQNAADFGHPSVLAVAEQCQHAVEAQNIIQFDNFAKQFVGSAICCLMEANGYEKSGTKKSVPHPAFSTGEYYQRKNVE